jgi:hypothetical protein
MTEAEREPPDAGLGMPNVARIYDYLLGGKSHLAADRDAAKCLRAQIPEIQDAAWANRGFLLRAVRWLASEGRIRQFIDIGSGLPTQNNTHDVAAKLAHDARVVYVDNDPIVRVHTEALLTGIGGVQVITADARDPEAVLGNGQLGALIDLAEPVGLLMVAVLPFIGGDVDPAALIRRYLGRLAPGSYLAASHVVSDHKPRRALDTIEAVYAGATERVYMRSVAQVERFFADLELVPPYPGAEASVTFAGQWGADDPVAADSDGSRWSCCGVARKP